MKKKIESKIIPDNKMPTTDKSEDEEEEK